MIRSKSLWWFILLFLLLITTVSLAILIKFNLNKTSKQSDKSPYDTFGEDSINTDLYVVKNKNTEDGIPFFSEQLAQVSEVEWQIRYFQPVLKSIIKKDNGIFLETEYLDMKQERKKILVFVGGTTQNKLFRYPEIDLNGARRYIENEEEIENNFKIGERLKIEYLQSAQNLEEGLKTSVCVSAESTICQSAPYVNKYHTEFLNFFRTGNINEDLYLIALSLSNNLNEK